MISIVMPTFNRGTVIKKSIESVLCQTFNDIELIIVDDGSTDCTCNVIKSFEDERIIYIKLDENRGACYARNIGMSMAKGDIIAFLDSDNVWNDCYLQEQNDAFINHSVDIVFFKVEIHLLDGQVVTVPKDVDVLVSQESIIDKMIFENIMDTNVTCIKRNCYDKWGGFDENLNRCQDWDYFLTLIEKGARVGFQNKVMARNYIMEDSISSKSELKNEALSYIFDKHYSLFKKRNRMNVALNGLVNALTKGWLPLVYSRVEKELFQLNMCNYKIKLVLYGYGNRGKIIYKLLNNSIDIVGVVDRYIDEPQEIEVPFYRNVGDVNKADCVVVTIEAQCQKIIDDLSKDLKIPVYSFEDFVGRFVHN